MHIIVRGDSGFCRQLLLRWCERHDVGYVIGVARNARLQRQVAVWESELETGGGAGADGLLQRFGLMVYQDISPDWREVDRYPDSALREAVNLLTERLDSLNPAEIGAEVDLYGGVPLTWEKRPDESQNEFEDRAAMEARKLPRDGAVRVFYLWLSGDPSR